MITLRVDKVFTIGKAINIIFLLVSGKLKDEDKPREKLPGADDR